MLRFNSRVKFLVFVFSEQFKVGNVVIVVVEVAMMNVVTVEDFAVEIADEFKHVTDAGI